MQAIYVGFNWLESQLEKSATELLAVRLQKIQHHLCEQVSLVYVAHLNTLIQPTGSSADWDLPCRMSSQLLLQRMSCMLQGSVQSAIFGVNGTSWHCRSTVLLARCTEACDSLPLLTYSPSVSASSSTVKGTSTFTWLGQSTTCSQHCTGSLRCQRNTAHPSSSSFTSSSLAFYSLHHSLC